MQRCPWCGDDPLYVAYHDFEWGCPVHDDRKHFEFLLLETQQAGLSWRCILGKREAYRRAFAGFEAEKVARFSPTRVEKLMGDPGIVRNRRKIEGAIRNARAFIETAGEFSSFDSYIWSFVGGAPIIKARRSLSQIPVTTEASDALASDLKARGFAYVGSTTIYAHMQAIGMVNDYLTSCFRWAELGGADRRKR